MINKSDSRKIKRLLKRFRRYDFLRKLFVIIGSLFVYMGVRVFQLSERGFDPFLTCITLRLLEVDTSCDQYSGAGNFLIFSIIFVIIFKIIMEIECLYLRSGTIRKVSGNSMFPTICNGDLVKVRFFNCEKDKLKKGDIVGFKLPLSKRTLSMILGFRNPTLVKRIDRIYKEENSLRVLGDNDGLYASWDSRHFGNIKFENIEHIVEETISLRDYPFLDNK